MENESRSLTRPLISATIFAALAAWLLWGFLFDDMYLGANIPLLVLAFYAALLIGLKGRFSLTYQHNWVLLLFIAGFAATFALYNNSFLLFLNICALAILIAAQVILMAQDALRQPYSIGFVEDACHCLFVKPFHRIGTAYGQIFSSGKNPKRKRVVFGILIGAAIALPTMAILLLLLSWGDMVFSHMLQDLFNIDTLWDVLAWVALFIFLFTLATSFFVSVSEKRKAQAPCPTREPTCNLPAVYIILVAAIVPLLAFSVVQFLFLFGHSALPSGITYSEYARSGFFQLCAAAILVFTLTAILLYLTRSVPKKHQRWLKILYTLACLAILLLLVSAFSRMVLYEEAFLFTRLRLYTQAFMIFLALLVILLLVYIWHRQIRLGKFVFFLSAVCLLALSYWNVDAFIAQQNTAAYTASDQTIDESSRRPDLDYLLSLSVDALPAVLQYLETQAPDSRDWQILQDRQAELETKAGDTSDIRSWNLGRQNAQVILETFLHA